MQNCLSYVVQVPLHRSSQADCFLLAADEGIVIEAAKVVEAACIKSEDNKLAFMSMKIGDIFTQALASSQTGSGVIASVSRAVVRLTTADDERPAASRWGHVKRYSRIWPAPKRQPPSAACACVELCMRWSQEFVFSIVAQSACAPLHTFPGQLRKYSSAYP